MLPLLLTCLAVLLQVDNKQTTRRLGAGWASATGLCLPWGSADYRLGPASAT